MNDADTATAEEEQVMSEVHLGCPPGLSGPHISHFTISLPPDKNEDEMDSMNQTIGVDEDGDLVLIRRNSNFFVHRLYLFIITYADIQASMLIFLCGYSFNVQNRFPVVIG